MLDQSKTGVRVSRTNFSTARIYLVIVMLVIGTIGCFPVSALCEQENARRIASENESVAVSKSKLWTLDSVIEAISAFAVAAEMWKRLNEPERASFCFIEAAKLAGSISRNDDAFRFLKASIGLSVKYRLTEHEAIAASIYSLTSIQKGDKPGALRFRDNALRLKSSVKSAEARGYVLFCAGMYENRYGNMKLAVDYFEESSRESEVTDNFDLQTNALTYLGYSYLREGEPLKAIEAMERSLTISLGAGYRKGEALSYLGIAYTRYFLGEKQKSLDFFNQSSRLFPLDFEWNEKARIMNAVGQIFSDFGDLKLAEESFKTASDHFSKEGYLFGKILSLLSLGEIYLSERDPEKADRAYSEAKSLSVRLGDKFGLGLIAEGMGKIAMYEGNFNKATQKYQEALDIFEKKEIRVPYIWNLLGIAFEKKKDLATARRYFNMSVQNSRRTKNSVQLSESLYHLAKLDRYASRFDEAYEHATESVNLGRKSYLDVNNTGLKRSFGASINDRFKLLIEILMARKVDASFTDNSCMALQVSEEARARTLLDTLRVSEFAGDNVPESIRAEKDLMIRLNARSTRLTELIVSESDESQIEDTEIEVHNLEHELEEVRANLALRKPQHSSLESLESFDISDFRSNFLKPDDLLLEFSVGNESSYLWCVSRNSVDSYQIPSQEVFRERIERLRNILLNRGIVAGETIDDFQRRLADAEQDYVVEARSLSEELLGQVADKLKGKRLIIVADGRLQYFPIGALPMPGSGSDDPILLTNEVVYSPSASALKLFKSENPTAKKPEKDLLVFADPVFSKNDDRLTGLDTANSGFVSTILGNFRAVKSLDELSRLPESEGEARSISNEIGGFRSEVRAGFAANRDSALNTDITNYKILHFATHGLIDEKRPELSGILLSLYDQNGKRNDGGFIRLQDVYGLNLRSDLVVLSACDTGIGKEVRGEGVMSLTNAFLQAGSKTVVSSLWKVDDAATKELMSEFYRGMASDGLTVAAALRQAQIKLYNDPKFHSPFYWAAFTMQGDYDKAPQISTRFAKWTYVAAGLCGILLFFYLFRVGRELNLRKFQS